MVISLATPSFPQLLFLECLKHALLFYGVLTSKLSSVMWYLGHPLKTEHWQGQVVQKRNYYVTPIFSSPVQSADS